MKATKKHHYTLFFITLLMAAVCAVLMLRVNVNSDMTKYLPDDSQMKQGLEILGNEFNASQMTGADVKVMFHGLDVARVQPIADSLALHPEVEGVSFQQDDSGVYTLYELNVPKSVDQKALGLDIRKEFGRDVVVETSQDGNTPSMLVLIIATFLIVFILVLMAQSWLEPLIFLIATGVAVALNVGTNAFLPSVSITTNYIVAILQMVLSLDYSIVLINRYRQEQAPERSSVEAVNIAMRKAFPSIMSSALTTVVGLLMLCFMRLKIGLDMGVVLAKGVVFSLICAFTVLPSLLVFFHKGVVNANKKTFVLPTDGIARYATRCKVPLSLFAVALFVAAFYFSGKTDISFAMARESEILKVFPQKNPIVLIYDTKDDMAVIELADSLKQNDAVELVVSHSTLLKKPYTAEAMVTQVKSLTRDFADYIKEPMEGLDQLTPEVLKLVYYMKYQDDAAMEIAFPDMAQFVLANCKDNPLFAKFIDADMMEQLNLLQSMTELEAETTEEMPSEPVQNVQTSTSEPAVVVTEEKPKDVVQNTEKPTKNELVAPKNDNEFISVVAFMPRLYAAMPSFESEVLATIVDTNMIRRKMTVDEMTEFIGSTPYQTKMVYSFSKAKDKKMTPLEYVHFLADDLFQRKALAAFVNAEQKKGLIQRMQFMDDANANKSLSAAEMTRRLTEFGIGGLTEEKVKAIAFLKTETPVMVQDTISSKTEGEVLPKENPSVQEPMQPVVAENATITQPVRKPVKRKKSIDEVRSELFYDMMYSGKTYTSEEMAQCFKQLGYAIEPEMLSLLYAYYGCSKHYDETLSMSIEQLVDYGLDTLVNDSRLAAFIDDGTRAQLAGVRPLLDESIGMMRTDQHSLMAVITNLPIESAETYDFIDKMDSLCDEILTGERYTIGESVMYSEMKKGFSHELNIVTILTVLAIFLIVAISFRSLIVPTILVMTVMTAVYVNVVFSGIFSGTMLYLAYLIVQSILMGATIDYGILFTNYYKEYRESHPIDESVRLAYRGSIRTIMTSGLIMVAAPGAMAFLVDDMAISAIVGSLAAGALVAVVLIMAVLPGVLVAFDRWVVRKK